MTIVGDVIGGSTAAVRGLKELPTERLEAQLTELAGHLAAAECRFLALIAEYDRRGAYQSWGCISCAAWLSWKCGLDARSARDRVRVARALEKLPAVREAFANGQLSYSKVRAITRVATSATERDLVMLAEHAPTEYVERIVRTFRRGIDAEEERRGVRDRQDRTAVHVLWDDDDRMGVLIARLAPEDAEIVGRALEAAREEISTGGGSAEPPPGGPLSARALVAMAESYLANGAAARKDRYLGMVHVDAEVLVDDTDGRCELDDGPALSPETARRLLCDAPIVAVVRDSLGKPAKVGKKTKSVPTRVKRAVRARDRGCRFPGCGQRKFTEIHHLRWRSRGGAHTLDNLVELCWHHHWLVHEGGWSALVDASGELVVHKPNGERLVSHPVTVYPDDGGIERRNAERGITVDPGTVVPTWYGDPLDLDHVMTSLMQQWVREHPETPSQLSGGSGS